MARPVEKSFPTGQTRFRALVTPSGLACLCAIGMAKVRHALVEYATPK